MASDIKRSVLVAASLLGGFSVIGMGLVALTHVATDERILENERELMRSRLQELVPAASYDNDMLHDVLMVHSPELLGTAEPVPAYRARLGGQPVAVVLPVVAPEGYSGAIKLLVAIRADGALAGVRVVSHKETPGLGDGIEHDRSDWIESFDDQSLDNLSESEWAVKRDGGVFDQFTGATITPRAVVQAVYKALQFFRANRQALVAAPGAQANGEG